MANPDTQIPLREKKYARTKIGLSRAFVKRLGTTRFADISIKEVCESVEVSEGTFFNYFPQKVDVVYYFQKLVALKIDWEIQKKGADLSPLALIEMVFDLIAKEMEPQPYLFYEMISIFTSEKVRPKEDDLSVSEKLYAYPECAGIENVSVQLLETSFSALIKEAKKQGSIPEDVKLTEAVIALMVVMLGVPLAIPIEDFGKVKQYFKGQLALLWKAWGVRKHG
jgi:AcrR family transcriptional regulator